jgi:hypothetical protein
MKGQDKMATRTRAAAAAAARFMCLPPCTVAPRTWKSHVAEASPFANPERRDRGCETTVQGSCLPADNDLQPWESRVSLATRLTRVHGDGLTPSNASTSNSVPFVRMTTWSPSVRRATRSRRPPGRQPLVEPSRVVGRELVQQGDEAVPVIPPPVRSPRVGRVRAHHGCGRSDRRQPGPLSGDGDAANLIEQILVADHTCCRVRESE